MAAYFLRGKTLYRDFGALIGVDGGAELADAVKQSVANSKAQGSIFNKTSEEMRHGL